MRPGGTGRRAARTPESGAAMEDTGERRGVQAGRRVPGSAGTAGLLGMMLVRGAGAARGPSPWRLTAPVPPPKQPGGGTGGASRRLGPAPREMAARMAADRRDFDPGVREGGLSEVSAAGFNRRMNPRRTNPLRTNRGGRPNLRYPRRCPRGSPRSGLWALVAADLSASPRRSGPIAPPPRPISSPSPPLNPAAEPSPSRCARRTRARCGRC
jgi:hypothetical protein